MRWMLPMFAAAATSGAALLMTTAPAQACGGFFCDNTQPVNQAAERIIFSRNEAGQVTALIQILYEGPSDRFAWMLPVAGNPTVSVSSDLAFQRLQAATNPTYQLTTTIEGECMAQDFAASAGGFDTTSSQDTFVADSASQPDSVSVVAQGNVGPYDYVVISVDNGVSAPADVAVEWLQENGFDIDDAGAARIGPYLEGGMNLLSFRLTKGNDAGSIRPVVIGFGEGVATIPIRPTAVAATDDMGVMVWVLGPHRAYPVNYKSLELNEALINWFNPGPTYNDVVIEAANQAGGQGFVTEMSGPANLLADTIFDRDEARYWTELRSNPTNLATYNGLIEAIRAFGNFDGFADALSEHLTLPDNVTIEQFLACSACYNLEMDEDGVLANFDVQGFIAAMDADVIDPMQATADLFKTGTVTRLYTTLSADEMTLDPSFDFNPDLAPVSAFHDAERVIECSPSFTTNDAPWRVTLGDGQVVRGFARNWPFSIANTDMPANSRILRVGPTGQGEVLVNNAPVISESVAANNASVTRQVKTLKAEGGGCAGGDTGEKAGWLAALLGLVALRRRRTA